MTTIKFDHDLGDIFIDATGGCISVVDGCDEIIQCIKQEIYSLDLSLLRGVNVNSEAVTSLVKSAINSVEGVLSLTSFSVVEDNIGCGAVKGLSINFNALTTCGEITVGV